MEVPQKKRCFQISYCCICHGIWQKLIMLWRLLNRVYDIWLKGGKGSEAKSKIHCNKDNDFGNVILLTMC